MSPGSSPDDTPTIDDDFFKLMCATPVASSQLPPPPSVPSTTRRTPTSRARSQADPSNGSGVQRTRAKLRRMDQSCAKGVRVGQAILDAAAVVKELVENSIDAGATRIDITLRGKGGTERITVSDNGSGVASGDRPKLCTAHATSKLSKFDDLDSISTLGFRGEAMSAISALADVVTVVTRTQADEIGSSLVYSEDGSLLKETPTARNRGTTVHVERLFTRLPVRLTDAVRHSSRHMARCLSTVQNYALCAPRVRFDLRVDSNSRLVTQPLPGKSIQAAQLSALRSVLGRTVASGMSPFENSDLLSDGSYAVSGFVSKSGSGAAGRQFVFLNERPVDMPRVSRAINESFRRLALSSSTSPAFVLFLSVPQGAFDVNLAPDKRTVMVHRESELIAGIQKVLEGVWSSETAADIPANTGKLKDAAPRVLETSGPTIIAGPCQGLGASQPRRIRCAPSPRAQERIAAKCTPGRTDSHEVSRTGQKQRRGTLSYRGSPATTHVDDNDPEAEVVRVRHGTLMYSLHTLRKKRSRASDSYSVGPHSGDLAIGEGPPTKRVAFSDAAGSDEVDESRAERELTLSFDKNWFSELKVLGQFNFGFIICLLQGMDLFIVDQHAADEKKNYEHLEKTTKIETQTLVKPLPLDLGVEDELLVAENIERFRAGGFGIEYRPDKPPTRRLRLRSQPVSKRTLFVLDDFQELLASLKCGTVTSKVLRPSRVRSMFASRACRMSVMVGMPLTAPVMLRVVRNLQHLDHPWSCPHGRPTMRHLIRL